MLEMCYYLNLTNCRKSNKMGRGILLLIVVLNEQVHDDIFMDIHL